jgi:2-polyprenyl-3-methyl-5-hydroxy-6-metoxy-1,4-benzoquinol methylase
MNDPREMVRRGYDAVSYQYRRDDADEGRYAPWIAGLCERVPARADILDLGCGCGVPVARSLARAGHTVTGVDFSEVQVRRARRLVPAARFVKADVTATNMPTASFDAVVCLYAMIHLPLDAQAPLLARIGRWLRPDGWLLATVGHRCWTGTDENWLGSGAAMWWSHADTATYHAWIAQAGLDIIDSRFVAEGRSGHTLLWARRPQPRV